MRDTTYPSSGDKGSVRRSTFGLIAGFRVSIPPRLYSWKKFRLDPENLRAGKGRLLG
jgi:hypothetical protein